MYRCLLKEIFEAHGCRHGTLASLSAETGIGRHHLSALLRNEPKFVSLEKISRLVDCLVRRGYLPADAPLDALFEQESFWTQFSSRIDVYLAARGAGVLEPADVSSCDANLVLALLRGLARAVPRKDFTFQKWSTPADPDLRGDARRVYAEFLDAPSDRSLVAVDSGILDNPLTELIIAQAFGVTPGVPAIAEPDGLRPPVAVVDPDRLSSWASCLDGAWLKRREGLSKAGIYYRMNNGRWKRLAGKTSDAALVVYRHDRKKRSLQLAVKGFSGHATDALARHLDRAALRLHPPAEEVNEISVGTFLVGFDPRQTAAAPGVDLSPPAITQVITSGVAAAAPRRRH